MDTFSKKAQTVKSYVRVRPVIEQDLDGMVVGSKTMAPICVAVDADQRTVVVKSKLYEHKQFKCLRAFDHLANQDEVYKKTICRDVCQGVLTQRQSLIVLAYGNTCAGKSYSIFNYEPDVLRPASTLPDARKRKDAHDQKRHNCDGLAFKCVKDLFDRMDSNCVIRISFCQLYQEKFYDLLASDSSQPRSLRESSASGVYVEDLELVEVASVQEARDVILSGLSVRTTRRTHLNMKSSRAHAILNIHIHDRGGGGDRKPVMIQFFDLAGSEKQAISKIPNKSKFMESVNINKSISCLSMVIHRLSAKQKDDFIPFRDSKLTRLLSTSLRNGARLSIISHICPTQLYYENTVATLKFALRAMKIVYVPSEVEKGEPEESSEKKKSPGNGTLRNIVMRTSSESDLKKQESESAQVSAYHPYVMQESTPAQVRGLVIDREKLVEGMEVLEELDLLSIAHHAPKLSPKKYSATSVERMMRSLEDRQRVIEQRRLAGEESRASHMKLFRELCESFGESLNIENM